MATPNEGSYFLVLKGLKLRDPIQYADMWFPNEQDAQLARRALRGRGLKYVIYDAQGVKVKGWKR